MDISKHYASISVSKTIASETTGLFENCTLFDQVVHLIHLKGSLRTFSVTMLILEAIHFKYLKNGQVG